MVDVIVEFEHVSKYLPILKINVLYGNCEDKREILNYILNFIKVNKLEIIPYNENFFPNIYPNLYLDYPIGIAVFAQFKTMLDAIKFKDECKIP